MKSFIQLFSALFLLAILSNSCAVRIEKRTFNKGYMIDFNNKNTVAKTTKEQNTTNNEEETKKQKHFTFSAKKQSKDKEVALAEANEKKPLTLSSKNSTSEIAEEKNNENTEVTAENTTTSSKQTIQTPLSKLKTFKTLKKTVKEQNSSKGNEEIALIILVLLALLLPPLAVYFVKDIGTEFWISLILTLLFWVPGVVYALLIVFDVI